MVDKKKGNSKFDIWQPAIIALSIAFGVLLGVKLAQPNSTSFFSKTNIAATKGQVKVDEVLAYIQERYVDSVDVNKLAEALIAQVIDSLDPHSHYMNAEQVALIGDRLRGEYKGLGIEYLQIRDTVVIQNVFDKSPAFKAGVEVGDVFLSANQIDLSGKDLSRADLIKILGQDNDELNIRYYRPKTQKLDSLIVILGAVHMPSVSNVIQLDEETVLIKISQFYSRTSKEFLDALEPFVEANKLNNLIIDLRGNPGGVLQESVKILNQFFDEKGKLLVFTEGLNSDKKEYKTAGKNYLNIDQLFILIDEESASASEIVAGALQDWDRAIIIGRRSFGKGLVQEQYDLSAGGKMRLTIAKYYTPSGRLIQKQLNDYSAYEDEFYHRGETGEWLDALNIPLPDSTSYYTAEGDTVYGGRGIVPDVFIPIDSFDLNENNTQFYVMAQAFAFDLFRNFPNIKADDFNAKTAVLIDNELDKFLMSSEYLKQDAAIINQNRILFDLEVKRQLANYYFGSKKAWEIEQVADPFVKAALKLIH